MTWKKQVGEKIAKGRKMGNMIRRLGRGGRGMGLDSMRTMYLATARAAMEYGAGAWWSGQTGASNAFDKVHEQAFQKMRGQYWTALAGAVICEAAVQPTAARLNQKNRMRLAKALPRKDHRMIDLCRDRLIDNPITPWGKNRGTIRAVAEGERLWGELDDVEVWGEVAAVKADEEARVVILGGGEEEIERQKQTKDGENEMVVYTDGSMREGRVGAGVLWKEGGEAREGGYYLWKSMEVFDAEMLAIKEGIKWGTKTAAWEGRTQVTVRADNQAAIQRPLTSSLSHGEMLAKAIRKEVAKAHRQNVTVQIEWVKGHAGVEGNEQGDRVAKKATQEVRVHKEAYVSTAFLARSSKEETARKWDERWEKEASKGKNDVGTPRNARKWKGLHTEQKLQVLVSRLRTGHIRCGAYLHRIGTQPSAQCQCGAEKPDVPHILPRCRLTHESRMKAQKELANPNISTSLLLYDLAGVAAVVGIWKEFEKMRHQYQR